MIVGRIWTDRPKALIRNAGNMFLVVCLMLWSAAEANSNMKSGQDCSVVGWIPYWDQKEAWESFHDNVDLIDYVSMFWYHLGPDGAIRKYKHAHADQEMIKHAQDHGVKVFALVANLPDDQRKDDRERDWDRVRVELVIGSAERRQEHIDALMELTDRMGFDGINIDYEALPGSLRSEFTHFIKELGAALHKRGKLLAVALHPKVGEGIGEWDNGSHAQDWDALPKYADQLHLMSYGEHDSSTRPGPIASLDWLTPILRYARETRKIPSDSLFMGIPLYAEAWEAHGKGRYRAATKLSTYTDVRRAVAEYGVESDWDERSSSPFLRFKSKQGRDRVVWFEDGTSVGEKLALAKKFGVCNVGLWRLGGEDPSAWEVLRQMLDRND